MNTVTFKKHLNNDRKNFFIEKLITFGLCNLPEEDKMRVELFQHSYCGTAEVKYLYNLCRYNFLLD